MSGLTPEQIEVRIFDVIMRHQRIPKFDGTGGSRCVGCDHCDGATDGPNSPRHVQHVAKHLAPVVAALIAEAVEEARGEDAKAVRALAYELIQPGRGLGTTFVSGVRAGAFEAGQQFKALGARIARGEVSP